MVWHFCINDEKIVSRSQKVIVEFSGGEETETEENPGRN
jgi:hypothetical protein